ncbi:MAG: hypothetical protein WBE48_22725 [Xanthobacteraceae bacterium]|jgi:hypothetical protein
MPSQDGFRLYYLGHTEKTWPQPNHPYEQYPIAAAQSKARPGAPQGDVELMTEKQVLGFKSTTRLEQAGDNISSI